LEAESATRNKATPCFLGNVFTVKGWSRITSAAARPACCKEVAGDFNPIHDPGCPPLLRARRIYFSLSYFWRFGLSTDMTFHFSRPAGLKTCPANFAKGADGTIQVCDQARQGVSGSRPQRRHNTDKVFIEEFTLGYVAAFGQNFPPHHEALMESNGVMFNPTGQLVMYDSMTVTHWIAACSVTGT